MAFVRCLLRESVIRITDDIQITQITGSCIVCYTIRWIVYCLLHKSLVRGIRALSVTRISDSYNRQHTNRRIVYCLLDNPLIRVICVLIVLIQSMRKLREHFNLPPAHLNLLIRKVIRVLSVFNYVLFECLNVRLFMCTRVCRSVLQWVAACCSVL